MSGTKGKSGGPRKNAGGARAGAGRPKRAPAAPVAAVEYHDAQSYLEAVVRGREPADQVRVQAAKAILPFQVRRQRAPLAAPPPRAMQHAADLSAEEQAREAWRRKSEEVRARHARGKN